MTRQIIGCAFVSLDGVMQAPGGPHEDPSDGFAHGGWLWPVSDEVIDQQIGTLFSGPFDLLLGRRTYEVFAAYWPYAPADHPIAASFTRAAKYVLTGQDRPLDWVNSHRLADLAALAALKAGDGPDLVVQGSSTLYPQLLTAGLLDRLTLLIAPVVLGDGKRLFGGGTPPATLRLVSHQIGSGGVIAATYEPAGPVTVADPVAQEPNPVELARRAAIAAGVW
ncbi:MAG: dihydrofolate reductase family protein [Proteobacteria bacterium]|nr:dihydrofolate reductase family protein [Pseudomonadota bacterium]